LVCRQAAATSEALTSASRNFHAVWPSLFATSMGLMAFLPTLALYVGERFAITDPGELAFWASAIYGIAPIAAAIAGPIWGALGDRLGKKPMAIRANLAIAVSTALMPLAPEPWVLLLLRLVQGVLAGYIAPAMAMVTHEVPRAQHGLLLARMQVAMAVGAFLGPLLGAAVAYTMGREALFWVTSVLTALAALRLHCCAVEVPVARAAGAPSFGGELRQAFAELLRQPVFAWLLVLVLLLRLGQNMLEPFVALWVRELGPQWLLAQCSADRELGLELTIGAAFAVLAIAQWFFTPWWGRLADRHGPLRCLAMLGLLLALVHLAMAATTSIDGFLLWRTLGACLMAGSMTLAYAAASKRVADHRRTFAFSLVQSCMQLGFGLGPQLGGYVATAGGAAAVDYGRVLWAAAALTGLAGAGMLCLRRANPAAGHSA